MVAARMLTPDALDEKASRYSDLIEAALSRGVLRGRRMNVLRNSADGKTTRESVSCDFRSAAAIADIDNHIMIAIKDLLAVARERGATASVSRFSDVALHAIDVLGSVSRMSYQEILEELHPALKKRNEKGRVFAFPPRFTPATDTTPTHP